MQGLAGFIHGEDGMLGEESGGLHGKRRALTLCAEQQKKIMSFRAKRQNPFQSRPREVETLNGDAQGRGDLLQGRERRAVLGVLDSADVALRKATLCRQLFLGELGPGRMPSHFHAEGKSRTKVVPGDKG
jgi:hypothetical protein